MLTAVEIRSTKGWHFHKTDSDLFEDIYSVMGFLADVRNYSGSESLAPYRGTPADMDVDSMLSIILRATWSSDFASAETAVRGYSAKSTDIRDRIGEFFSYLYSRPTWVSLAELLQFDYEKSLTDQRDNSRLTTYREFLGEMFFVALEVLQSLGKPNDVRLVLCFG